MILILGETNLCPRSCPYFHFEQGDRLLEQCNLPDGRWQLTVKDGELLECPLGKWDLKIEMGCAPPTE